MKVVLNYYYFDKVREFLVDGSRLESEGDEAVFKLFDTVGYKPSEMIRSLITLGKIKEADVLEPYCKQAGIDLSINVKLHKED